MEWIYSREWRSAWVKHSSVIAKWICEWTRRAFCCRKKNREWRGNQWSIHSWTQWMVATKCLPFCAAELHGCQGDPWVDPMTSTGPAESKDKLSKVASALLVALCPLAHPALECSSLVWQVWHNVHPSLRHLSALLAPRVLHLDGPIRENWFADPKMNPVLCKSGYYKLRIADLEAIRVNRSNVRYENSFSFCESIRANRPDSRCESLGHQSSYMQVLLRRTKIRCSRQSVHVFLTWNLQRTTAAPMLCLRTERYCHGICYQWTSFRFCVSAFKDLLN